MSAAQKPTVIITRPRPFAQELAAGVGRAGWKPIVLDVLATKTAENVAELRRDLRWLLPVEQAIFTSRSSVTHAFEILDRDDFSSSGITAMGAGSASDLKAKGFASVLLPELGNTSEDLLALDQYSAHRAGRAIIFCAPGGRDVIQRELENRGWQVDIAEVYERVVQAPKASNLSEIQSSAQVITVCTNGTAVAACQEQLPADVWQQMLAGQWVVISERLETLVRDAGAENIFQSEAPDNQGIINAIDLLLNP